MSREQLVVIDMQEDFISDKQGEKVERVKKVLQEIITSARDANIPITYTMYPDNSYGSIVPEIEPKPNEIFVKNNTSAFLSKEFCQRIQGSHLLYVTGCNVHACIRLTVEDAVKSGLEVVIFKNATLAHDDYLKKTVEAWLSLWFTRGVKIMDYRSDINMKTERS